MQLVRFTTMLAAVVVGVLYLPGAARAANGANHSPEFKQMQAAMNELAQTSGGSFEIMYINMIIPHHEGAIEMARMVVNDAPHQAVRTAAAKIIKDQQQEINELTSWLKAWYGQRVRPDQRMMMDASMMQHMQQADAAMREKMFLAVMREHHQSAVDIGQLVLQKATHRQLKGQAQTMVDSQRREQQQFGTWLQQWYGITAPKPTGDMQDGMDAVMGMVMPETGAEEPLWAVLAAGALALFGGGFLLRRKLA